MHTLIIKMYILLILTYFSISFLALGLSRSILVMMLTWGISSATMALKAAITPEMNWGGGGVKKRKKKKRVFSEIIFWQSHTSTLSLWRLGQVHTTIFNNKRLNIGLTSQELNYITLKLSTMNWESTKKTPHTRNSHCWSCSTKCFMTGRWVYSSIWPEMRHKHNARWFQSSELVIYSSWLINQLWRIHFFTAWICSRRSITSIVFFCFCFF